MNIILSQVKVLDPHSSFNNRVVDISIKNGKISEISKSITDSKVKRIPLKGHCVSPGWVDIGTTIGEPGFEHREDLESVSQSALAGGFTSLAPFPNTEPAIDGKSGVAFLINKAKQLPIFIYPIGAISKGTEGKDLSEILDMMNEGAVAFSDGNPLNHHGLLLRALDYVKSKKGLIVNQALDASLAPGTHVHESALSTQLGLKGQSALSEKMELRSQLDLVQYSDSRLLFHLVSSKMGIDAIKKGKKEGAKVGATVSGMHLCFDESKIADFDVNYKVSPPLRSNSDRNALVKALAKGHIDIICSNHTPLDPEEKVMAFSDASPGSIGLQTLFPLVNSMLNEEVPLAALISALSTHPRKWLNLPDRSIKVGNEAELTLFNSQEEWTYHKKDNHSKSDNSPLFGRTFKGKVTGTIAKNSANWNP